MSDSLLSDRFGLCQTNVSFAHLPQTTSSRARRPEFMHLAGMLMMVTAIVVESSNKS